MQDQWWLLLVLGLAVGTLGTLIGTGGGFILVPVLLMLAPASDPVHITAISLAVVFLSATSGSIAYIRMKRVDLHSALWLGLATLPGAILGAISTSWVPRQQFNLVFGILLVMASVYLLVKPGQAEESKGEPGPKDTKRELTDASGTQHIYHFSMPVGISLSVAIGYLSSLLGIGGGIIHVPVLSRTLNFPVHIATATSQVILGFMALVGTITHLTQGHLDGSFATVGLVGVGSVVGAQLGARLSSRMHGAGIIRILAIALGVVGVRIGMMGLK